MIGQLLAGRYRVLQVLGAGGFGQTYITEDLHLPGQPKCVLKHLKPASTSPDVLEIARKLFQKEAETLQKLGSYEQIPRLLAFFEERQEFYLVQEYIVGHTLSHELSASQKWSESGVLRLLREVLTILEFVHGQGVIHRDIKPDNIMRRDTDGKLVLIDFGAIKQVRVQQYPNNREVTKTIAIGTPGYMPLEQAGGTPRPSSDLYALGVICIQALTGLHPTELSEDDATGELQWRQLVTVSPPLLAFLTKITSYHFKDRYATAHEALQALPQLNGAAAYQPPTAPNIVNNQPERNAVDPTAATWVAAPAASQSLPINRNFPVSAKRPDETQASDSKMKWVTSLLLLSVSAGLGYWWVRPQMLADQFDTLVNSDRCRVATPNKVSGFVTKVRDEPDRSAPIKVKIAQGEKLLFVATRNEFVQIEQRNGQQGWVFNDQIGSCNVAIPTPSTFDSPSPSTPQPPVSKSPSVVKPDLPTPSPADSSLDDPTTTDPDPQNSPTPSDPTALPTIILPSAPDIMPTVGVPLGYPPSPESNPPSPSTIESPIPPVENSTNPSPSNP
jgi:serine/threonine protein kinase